MLGPVSLGVAIGAGQIALGDLGTQRGHAPVGKRSCIQFEGFLLRFPVVPRQCGKVLPVAATHAGTSSGLDAGQLSAQATFALVGVILVADIGVAVLAMA
jgi:hypothetical protein